MNTIDIIAASSTCGTCGSQLNFKVPTDRTCGECGNDYDAHCWNGQRLHDTSFPRIDRHEFCGIAVGAGAWTACPNGCAE